MPTNPVLASKDPNILLNRVRDEFPTLKWKNYRFLDKGWDHEVLILDESIVFRFPNSTEYLNVLKDEVELMDYLSDKIEINIPKYIYVSKDYSFAGYKLIGGNEITEEFFRKLSDRDKNTVTVQLSVFLAYCTDLR